MSFVEADKYGEFTDKSFLISSGEYEVVSEQLVDAYRKMKNHEFDVDCGRSECTWCNFIKNDYVLPPDTIREDAEEENSSIFFGLDVYNCILIFRW